MDPSSPDVKRPWHNLISTPGPNPIQLRSLYMTEDSACPLSSLMACTRSTGQEAGKINGHETKRSITEREIEKEWQSGGRRLRKPLHVCGLVGGKKSPQRWCSGMRMVLCFMLSVGICPKTNRVINLYSVF